MGKWGTPRRDPRPDRAPRHERHVGRLLLEVQARIVAWLEGIPDHHAGPEAVAAVTHGDVITAVLFHYGGVSLDHVHRWEISPASVSTLEFEPRGARLVSVDDTRRAAGP